MRFRLRVNGLKIAMTGSVPALLGITETFIVPRSKPEYNILLFFLRFLLT
jgi:hypothetical protein